MALFEAMADTMHWVYVVQVGQAVTLAVNVVVLCLVLHCVVKILAALRTLVQEFEDIRNELADHEVDDGCVGGRDDNGEYDHDDK